MLSRWVVATRHSLRIRTCLVPSRDHLMVSGEYLVLRLHLHIAVNIRHLLYNEN